MQVNNPNRNVPTLLISGSCVPPGIEVGSVEGLAKLFKAQYGSFSDGEDENITTFAENADKFMSRSWIPSLEMGMVIIHNLKGEPYIRAKRWRDTMDIDPERIHADHWSEQPHQPASPFLALRPMRVAQPYIAPRNAGTAPDGQPDVNDPGHPGQPELTFKPMRPSFPAIREQPLVDANHCLKAYLLHTFQKRVNAEAADKYLDSFKTQKPKQTCGSFIDVFVTKFEYYITIRWSTTERMVHGFRTNVDRIKLQHIRDGLCKEFREHLDNNLNIVTQQQVDDEIQRWSRETIEGRKFFKSCYRPETTHTTSSIDADIKNLPTKEREIPKEPSSATSNNQSASDEGSSHGNNGEDQNDGAILEWGPLTERFLQRRPGYAPLKERRNYTSTDTTSDEDTKQSRDSEGINNYRRSGDGSWMSNSWGQLFCNYCGIPGHSRSACKRRIKDCENGIKRYKHPARGSIHTPTDPTSKHSVDSEGINNYRRSEDGNLMSGSGGELLCNYCGIPSHARSECGYRLRDYENGIKRNNHPDRGSILSNNRVKKEAQIKQDETTDHPTIINYPQSECKHRLRDSGKNIERNGHPAEGLIPPSNQGGREAQARNVTTTYLWNTHAPIPHPQPQNQQITQGQEQKEASARTIVTQTRNQTIPWPDNITTQNGPRIASLLPSGMVACNKCGDVSITWTQSANHYNNTHIPKQQARTCGPGYQL